jgi:hypothetical protein
MRSDVLESGHAECKVLLCYIIGVLVFFFLFKFFLNYTYDKKNV